MTIIETRRYEMLARVREFGEAHRDQFPEGSAGGEAFAAVASAVEKLDTQAVSKVLARGEGSVRKARARAALNDQLTAIGRTAAALAAGTPALGDMFRRRSRQRDHERLLTGRAFAHNAVAFEALFVRHGLPDTFIADLNDCVEALEEAIRYREARRDAQIVARVSIERALSSGLAAVRLLDAIVANLLHDDALETAVWKRARRVEYPHRKKRAAPPEPARVVTAGFSRPGGVRTAGGITS